MNIYVASSWRNPLQPAIVNILRQLGHDVYDFRNPKEGDTGFNWREIDPDWQNWTPSQWRAALKHPIAERGYESDITALRACDAVVFVLPCGRSASWEFGYAMGQGKKGYVVALDKTEPELMFREATIITSMSELFNVFEGPRAKPGEATQAQAEARTCGTCLHRCMDMDPYCAAPAVLKRTPFGVSLVTARVPAECLVNNAYSLWELDTRSGKS